MRIMADYELKEDENVFHLPVGAIVRSFTIRSQGNGLQVIVMHVEIDQDQFENVKRKFAIIQPNTTIPDNAFYAGTVEDDRDTWHIFELVGE